MVMEVKNLVDNFWITGFVDGEGCFSVSFNLRKKINHGIEVRPSFSLSQKKDSEGINYQVLVNIMKLFQGGNIRFSRNDQTWKYESRNLDHIWKNIIPFFETHPLITAKKNDFAKFKKICFLIRSKQHLSLQGIKEIIEIAITMNKSGKRKYDQDFLLKSLDKVKI